MQYKALISFSGLISMSMGEVREITDQKIVNDLLKAGYIAEIIEIKKEEEVKKTKKGGKKKSEN